MKKLRFRKETIAAAILFALTITLATASAQQVDNTNIFSKNQIVDYNIEYFKMIEVDSKLFFKLLITEDKENTAYVLEASIDGQPFTSCQIKEGYKSPSNIPLLYCFSEKQNKNIATVYRIKRVSFDGLIAYSGALTQDENSTSRKWNSSNNNPIIFQNEETSTPSNTLVTPIASAY
jgi:hypothetical protein